MIQVLFEFYWSIGGQFVWRRIPGSGRSDRKCNMCCICPAWHFMRRYCSVTHFLMCRTFVRADVMLFYWLTDWLRRWTNLANTVWLLLAPNDITGVSRKAKIVPMSRKSPSFCYHIVWCNKLPFLLCDADMHNVYLLRRRGWVAGCPSHAGIVSK